MAKKRTKAATAPVQVNAVEKIALQTYTEKAYLDYSMYVILDRALPHIGDGLKPVQRRIVYAMRELALTAQAKPKKSARTVGDVLGKYHPHGDTACYEAMVLMAQPFSYRYPLIDGQGNWGSADDPKSFAAMRYTESRLSAFAELLLSELGQGTVEWIANFDGTMDEPALLPARLPNVLLNGGSGIAVGMATDIPPHNLNEVVAALIHLLHHPKATVAELCQLLPAPDFPTAAEIITPSTELITLYETGRGSVKMRARYHLEQGDIIITALPYQVSGAKILEQIAAQMQAKKLPMVADLRDESTHETPTRLVIVPRSPRVDIEPLMAHLFATTDLEKNQRVNMNLINLAGRPQVMPLNALLAEWLAFRRDTTKKRLNFRLTKVEERLHILAGLLIAYFNLDEVIRIIREEQDPLQQLMQTFALDELQANAILDLRLRYLAKLEEAKLTKEQQGLLKEQKQLQTLLKSPAKLTQLIENELQEAAKQFGDQRRSPLVERFEARALSTVELVGTDPVTVVLSQQGWLRSAKGHDIDATTLTYRSGDQFLMAVQGKTNQKLVLFDSSGRSYSINGQQLPSARSQGEPASKYIDMPAGAQVVGILLNDPEAQYVLASQTGYGLVTTLDSLMTRSHSGKAILTMPADCRALKPVYLSTEKDSWIAVVSSLGNLLIFPAHELPRLTKGRGNKMIDIPTARFKAGTEKLVSFIVLTASQNLCLQSKGRQLTLKPLDWQHYQGDRGRRGLKLPKAMQQIEQLTVKEN